MPETKHLTEGEITLQKTMGNWLQELYNDLEKHFGPSYKTEFGLNTP